MNTKAPQSELALLISPKLAEYDAVNKKTTDTTGVKDTLNTIDTSKSEKFEPEIKEQQIELDGSEGINKKVKDGLNQGNNNGFRVKKNNTDVILYNESLGKTRIDVEILGKPNGCTACSPGTRGIWLDNGDYMKNKTAISKNINYNTKVYFAIVHGDLGGCRELAFQCANDEKPHDVLQFVCSRP